MCQRALSPLLDTQNQGNSHPFGNPAVLVSVYTNRENGVCIYTSQSAKIPTVDPPTRRGKTVGILNAALIEPGEIHASPIAAAMHFSEHTPEFRKLLMRFYSAVMASATTLAIAAAPSLLGWMPSLENHSGCSNVSAWISMRGYPRSAATSRTIWAISSTTKG